MEPAKTIIDKLGGCQAVAAACGLRHTGPWRWMQPKDSKGCTGGQIPAKYIPVLIEFGASKGVALTPNDFFKVAA